MLNKPFHRTLALLIILVPAVAVSDVEPTLKSIMQGLRDNLVEITDGLLTDNFDMVTNGATAIAAHPQIPASQVQLVAAELGQEMPAFKQLDTLVHDLSLEIDAAARAQDRDSAISAYRRMIDGCFACHQTYKDRVTAALSTPSEN